jgi:hypothetical protein
VKNKVIIVIVLSFLCFALIGVQPAAAAPTLTFIQFNRVGCDNDATGFRWSIAGTGGASYDVRTILSQGSNIFMDQIFPLTGDGTFSWGLFSDNTGGTVNAAFPMAPDTLTHVSLTVSIGGSLSFDYYCSGGAPVSGPPIPAGFVLRTITCNVAVFDAPGGSPVGSNAITNGQTWYVNPKSVKDAAGKAWTEIFVGGYNDGYVPTSCIGGYPANAPAGGE